MTDKTIMLHVWLADDHRDYAIFDDTWVVKRIGDRDDDYEPGSRCERNHASRSWTYEHLTVVLERGLAAEITHTWQAVSPHLASDASDQATVTIFCPHALGDPNAYALGTTAMQLLASTQLPIVFRFIVDYWCDTDPDTGDIVLKAERKLTDDQEQPESTPNTSRG